MQQAPETRSPAAGSMERIETLEEAIRRLRTISHEINNPLTALLGRAQILRSKVQGDPRAEKAAQVIEESASRLVDLAREMSGVLKGVGRDPQERTAAPLGPSR